MRRQRSTFPGLGSWPITRALRTGRIACAPSSVAFSTTRSIFCPFGTACAIVTRSALSTPPRSSGSPSVARTSLPSTSSVAAYAAPPESTTWTRSPLRLRRTVTSLRASSGANATRSPTAWTPSTKKRSRIAAGDSLRRRGRPAHGGRRLLAALSARPCRPAHPPDARRRDDPRDRRDGRRARAPRPEALRRGARLRLRSGLVRARLRRAQQAGDVQRAAALPGERLPHVLVDADRHARRRAAPRQGGGRNGSRRLTT